MDNIDLKIHNKLVGMFGTDIPQHVNERIKEELVYFEKHNCLGFLDHLSDYLRNNIKSNSISVRQAAGYSLVLYLLGINDINPLPLYKREDDYLGLIFDGYNLDFNIFKLKFKSLKETLSLSYCSDSFDIEHDGHVCHFVKNKLTKLITESNIKNKEVFDCGVAPYYAFDINADAGISSLLDNRARELIEKYDIGFDFENLVRVIALSHGQQVIEANEKIGRTFLEDMISSIDNLYNIITENIDNDLAISICEFAYGNKKIPDEIKKTLLAKGVSREIITFIDECQYLYTRGGAISIARSLVKLACAKTQS